MHTVSYYFKIEIYLFSRPPCYVAVGPRTSLRAQPSTASKTSPCRLQGLYHHQTPLFPKERVYVLQDLAHHQPFLLPSWTALGLFLAIRYILAALVWEEVEWKGPGPWKHLILVRVWYLMIIHLIVLKSLWCCAGLHDQVKAVISTQMLSFFFFCVYFVFCVW